MRDLDGFPLWAFIAALIFVPGLFVVLGMAGGVQ